MPAEQQKAGHGSSVRTVTAGSCLREPTHTQPVRYSLQPCAGCERIALSLSLPTAALSGGYSRRALQEDSTGNDDVVLRRAD